MKAKFVRLRSSVMLLIFSMGLIVGGQTVARAATIDHEKATLVSKLARYVSWPTEARQRKFIIGVYGDVEKHEFFSGYFANKGVKGKDIEVRLVKTPSQAKDVNILYISSLNQRVLSKLTDRNISDSHVLIITEDTKDLPKTMVDLSYNEQQSKINFKIIEDNVLDAKLTMPDLSYFVDNKDNREVLSASPTFTSKNQKSKQISAFKNKIEQQESSLNKLNESLSLSKENSEKYYAALQEQAERLKAVQQEDAKKSQEIKSKNQQLERLETQLQAQKKQLEASKQSVKAVDEGSNVEQDTAIIALTEELKVKNEELQTQNDELQKQNNIKNDSVIKLTKEVEDSKGQSNFQTLFYIFLIIAIIALVAAFMMWKKAKDAALQTPLPSKNEKNPLLPVREEQLIKSENFAALGYIATDITYAVGLSLDDLQAQLEATGDAKNATALKPVVTLLESFNLIAADQDDTKVQSFDVIAYTQKMLMLYDFEFSQSDIVYSYSGEKELTIKSVPSYVALILLNIINNSLKHGFDNNGNGKIALKIEKGNKGGAKITYSDDGKGMSKAVIGQVFDPFFTTQSSRGYVGVGMSTTYDLVKKKLAGDIKIDSQEGKGTTVTITLP